MLYDEFLEEGLCHDKGNLNFSFVTSDDGNSFHNFKKFTEPIVQAFTIYGCRCKMTGQ